MKTTFNKVLGKNIKSRRTGLGMTQMQLAVSTSIDMSFISRLERGVVNSSVESLIKISDALGCNVIDIIPKTNYPKKELKK
jgi:transcriptional regulator with XRE-family HTH domain